MNNRVIFTILIELLLLFLQSCDFELADDYIFDETHNQKYRLYDYYIDDSGNEGIVAYVSSSRIIILSLDEDTATWGPNDFAVYNVDSVSIIELSTPRFGIAMLQRMKSYNINKFPAQQWCDNKNHGRDIYVGSWRLPTFYEFKLIFGSNGERLTNLNSELSYFNKPQISETSLYWTCVEDHNNYIITTNQTSNYDKINRAIVMTPLIKTCQKELWDKSKLYHIRAIKYIYAK